MMKTHISMALVALLAMSDAVLAGISFSARAPGDEMSVRRSVAQQPEVMNLRGDYTAIVRRLNHLHAEDIQALLGKPITVSTNDLVLPIFAPNMAYVTGYAPPPGSDRSRVESFAVGSSGVLEVHVSHNGTSVARTVLYHRRDAHFIRLLKESDLTKRLEWDKKHFEQIKKRLPLPDLEDLMSKYVPIKKGKEELGQQPAGAVTQEAAQSATP